MQTHKYTYIPNIFSSQGSVAGMSLNASQGCKLHTYDPETESVILSDVSSRDYNGSAPDAKVCGDPTECIYVRVYMYIRIV